MTNSWRAYHIYYRDIDDLILTCVAPLLERFERQLDRRSWERHYLGGPHLRVRIRAENAVLDTIGPELEAAVRLFLDNNPSIDIPSYSPAQAAKLMDWEGQSAETDGDVQYRNNTIEIHPYPLGQGPFVSRQASELLEDFRHDVMPLALQLLASEVPKRENMLRLYFLNAILINGDLQSGSVTWKSHWEGFAASTTSEQVIERIGDSYKRNHAFIRELMLSIAREVEAGALDADPILAAWRDLASIYRTRVRQALEAGHQLTPQTSNLSEAEEACEATVGKMRRDSAFVRQFVSDPRFVASIQFDHSMLVPRTVTNMFYVHLASVGLRSVDKFSLCYFAHRAVEDHFACNLDHTLAGTIKAVVERQSHRLAETPR